MMMPNPEERSFLQSVGGKVVAAFLIGAVALALAWVVLRVGFREILVTVDRLSAPNEKLRIVNGLFHNITRLDQLQKAQALRNPEMPAGNFQQASRSLLLTIDTLRQMSAGNPAQLQRLDSMKAILHHRNELFDSYAKLKADFVQNEALASRIKSMGHLLANRKPQVDRSVIRTDKKVTTTTIYPGDSRKPRQTFFNRLFGSRKANLPSPLKQVEEDLKVQVDTLSVARRDNAIGKVQQIMRRIEGEQHLRTNRLMARELALVNTESQLHHQLLRILQALEAEEISLVKNNNQLATMVVNASISRINTILLVAAGLAGLLIFLIFTDISRSNRSRRQLIAAKEEAERLGQVKQRFLANMSHEIRTPLQAIIGFAEQLRHQQKPDPAFLEAIYRSSDHLLQIVNQVLDYSRIVSDTFAFEQKPFCLQQLAAEVVASLKPLAGAKNLELVLESELQAGAPVLGDAFRLRQVLYNLLGNAIKFTQQGRVTLQLSATDAGEKTSVRLAVRDTGIGIPAGEAERIFKVFEQVQGAAGGSAAGTGLGLSIVKSLVENQGGRISLSSVPGQGSVFTVELNYPKAAAAGLPAAPGLALPAGGCPAHGQVLVVDDDAFILQLCRAILGKHQVPNTCLSTGRSLLERDFDQNLQLVLLDIRMPEIGGLELCRVLRSRVPAACRIIALTAQALPEERQAILAQGFDGLLMKPFREQELLALLQAPAPVAAEALAPPVAAFQAPASPAPALAGPAYQQADFSVLIRMTGGEEALLQAVLQQFMTETQQDLDQLQQQLRSRRRGRLPRTLGGLLHRLAGRTGQLGARKLSARLQAAETALRDPRQSPEAWLGELAVLQQEVKALKAEVAGKLRECQAV
ncbi:MAG: hybrid sensor histidine kinase/response regulator [Adhaeribacter sp.]